MATTERRTAIENETGAQIEFLSVDHRYREDVDLVTRVRSDDQQAFAQLYDRHVDAVHRHCFRLTGSAATAEDLTAMVFLEAWRRRDGYRLVDGSAAPWLHGIAYNLIRNYRRASRRYRSAVSRLDASRSVSDQTDEIVDRVSAEEIIHRLLPTIGALPRQQREAIELCYSAMHPG